LIQLLKLIVRSDLRLENASTGWMKDCTYMKECIVLVAWRVLTENYTDEHGSDVEAM